MTDISIVYLQNKISLEIYNFMLNEKPMKYMNSLEHTISHITSFVRVISLLGGYFYFFLSVFISTHLKFSYVFGLS
jgi:hypothetical protein